MSLRIITLIETDLECRGDSPSEQREGKIARRVTQYWDMKGNLCFECDPLPDGTNIVDSHMTLFRKPE